jgi:hypothetical protein
MCRQLRRQLSGDGAGASEASAAERHRLISLLVSRYASQDDGS